MHVVSVALLSGGASVIAVWWLAPGAAATASFRATAIYEWLFWPVIALVAATGVSNLGLGGDGLMGSATGWDAR